MKIHSLIDQLQEFDPDAEVVVITENGHEYIVDSLDLADTGEVCLEVVEDGGI